MLLKPAAAQAVSEVSKKKPGPRPGGAVTAGGTAQSGQPSATLPPALRRSLLRSPVPSDRDVRSFAVPLSPPTRMPFFGDFTESSDPAGAPVADPLQFVKDCLPAESAACPLHVKGAWTALFKFFIGQPTEPGAFHKEIYRAVDSFGHMDTALRRILEIVAPFHVNPTSTVVFRFPLTPFAAGDDDAAAIRDAALRFVDVNNTGSGAFAFFNMLKSQVHQLGAALADAEPPVQGMTAYKTPDLSASTSSSKSTKPNAVDAQRIIDGELVDPALILAAFQADPSIESVFKRLHGHLLAGRNLLGSKTAQMPGSSLEPDWASTAFPHSGSKEDDARDIVLIASILPREVRTQSEYEIALQPLASVLRARLLAMKIEMKFSVSPLGGREGDALCAPWRAFLLRPQVDLDKGGMSLFNRNKRQLRGYDPSTMRPRMLTGYSVDDLLVPLDTFLRGIAYATVRVAHAPVRAGIAKAIKVMFDEMILAEFNPRTAFVLITAFVIGPMTDSMCTQLAFIRAHESQRLSNPSRFWVPNPLCLFDSLDTGVAGVFATPPEWHVMKDSISRFRAGVRAYHPVQGCKAWFWYTHLSHHGCSPGIPKPISLDSEFKPNAVLIGSSFVLCRQQLNQDSLATLDSQKRGKSIDLLAFIPRDCAHFERGESWCTGVPMSTNLAEEDWLDVVTASYYAESPVPPVACSPGAALQLQLQTQAGLRPSSPGATPQHLPNAVAVPAPGPAAPSGPPPAKAPAPGPSPAPGGGGAGGGVKPPKKKQKKTLAAASQPSTALYTASLHTVLAVERIVQAHGLYSFDAVKRANKAKDADPASQDYFDQLPYKVTAIHQPDNPTGSIQPMPTRWVPPGGWRESLKNKTQICSGDLVQHLFPDLVGPDTLYPGGIQGDMSRRINVGCEKKDQCNARHCSSSTTAGDPWTETQQMNLVAINRIHSLLAPELQRVFTLKAAADGDCHLLGPPSLSTNDRAKGFTGTTRQYTHLGGGSAAPPPAEYTSATAAAIDAAAY